MTARFLQLGRLRNGDSFDKIETIKGGTCLGDEGLFYFILSCFIYQYS